MGVACAQDCKEDCGFDENASGQLKFEVLQQQYIIASPRLQAATLSIDEFRGATLGDEHQVVSIGSHMHGCGTMPGDFAHTVLSVADDASRFPISGQTLDGGWLQEKHGRRALESCPAASSRAASASCSGLSGRLRAKQRARSCSDLSAVETCGGIKWPRQLRHSYDLTALRPLSWRAQPRTAGSLAPLRFHAEVQDDSPVSLCAGIPAADQPCTNEAEAEVEQTSTNSPSPGLRISRQRHDARTTLRTGVEPPHSVWATGCTLPSPLV